jgi:hypothetical protein
MAVTDNSRGPDRGVRGMSRYDGEYNPPVTQIEQLPHLTLSRWLWVQHGSYADTNRIPTREPGRYFLRLIVLLVRGGTVTDGPSYAFLFLRAA